MIPSRMVGYAEYCTGRLPTVASAPECADVYSLFAVCVTQPVEIRVLFAS